MKFILWKRNGRTGIPGFCPDFPILWGAQTVDSLFIWWYSYGAAPEITARNRNENAFPKAAYHVFFLYRLCWFCVTRHLAFGVGRRRAAATAADLDDGSVDLTKLSNSETNVVGTDWGIYFLGLVPIVSPQYVKAMKQLYEAGGVAEGSPQAIVNVIQQHTSPYFILFSIPRITIRADVVEFTKPSP
jgi:hypothetical protein